WLPALRAILSMPNASSKWHVAGLLDEIGEQDDIPFLRRLARSSKGSTPRASLGRKLARRLAPRYVIEDLGRIEIRLELGDAPPPSVRRKVLAMLCYLLTRPRFSATRDEVIDG